MHVTVTKVCNSVETISSRDYVVLMVDLDDVEWEIGVYGMDEITAPIDQIDMKIVSGLFPSLENYPITRPCGEIHLLIRVDHFSLTPQVVETNGNLLRSYTK